MERVGELGGVTYVNDSKATNQEAAIRALGAFTHGVHLILGGSLKGGDFAPLARAVAHGPGRGELPDRRRGRRDRRRAASPRACTRRATPRSPRRSRPPPRAATAGDTVLLAPACASFDQFRDFEDRGDQFRALVEELAA